MRRSLLVSTPRARSSSRSLWASGGGSGLAGPQAGCLVWWAVRFLFVRWGCGRYARGGGRSYGTFGRVSAPPGVHPPAADGAQSGGTALAARGRHLPGGAREQHRQGVGGTTPGGRRGCPRQGQAQGASAAFGRDRGRPTFRRPAMAPEVTTAPPARAAPSRPPPEVTTPAVAPPTSSSAASSTPPSAPTPSTLTAAAPSGIAPAAGQATSCAGVPPPPTSPFPPVDRVGRAGYGTRNQSRRPPAPGRSTWDAFRFPLHQPGADLWRKEIPYSVVGWTADTWEEAERLEAAIASETSMPPQSVSAGVILRSLPPNVRGGRLRRLYTVIGWCFVKCPGSHRRGRPCPDHARCLRRVNYPPMLGRPHEHHECHRCALPSPGQRFD